MDTLTVRAGDVVVTNIGVYQHWSLVSDRFCSAGKPMLISATKRTGTVKEEPWDVVTEGKQTYVAKIDSIKNVANILSDARSKIGNWSYSVTGNNCEHFVKWASGLHVESKQVKAGLGGAAAGMLLVGTLAENPKTIKFLGGALILGGLAVYATKATEQTRS